MTWLIFLVILVTVYWAFDHFYLQGGGPGSYPALDDPDAVQVFTSDPESEPQRLSVIKMVRGLATDVSNALKKHQLKTARAIFDSINDGKDYDSESLPVDAGGIPAEWVMAPAAEHTKRLLYIHGGGFSMGSLKSHRTITSKLSEISGCAVLAIDYRLLPENRFMDSVDDCRAAYQWILENGPEGAGQAKQLIVAGDSAGGNLALSLAAWLRDHKLRTPDAAVALSPLTDATFSGTSILTNRSTDVMLAPLIGILGKLPQFVKSLWMVWTYRVRPGNPVVSPLFGDLSNLPPTLIQASEAEMLLDDARRYVYKARASGSPVKLQTWTGMVHVWHFFYPALPQAGEAFREIGKFLEANVPES